jgi:hypothetical protein
MRNESIVRLEDGGEQKEFKIRQMSATQGEQFFFKVVLLLGGQTEVSKFRDPIAVLNALAGKPYDKVQELLDNMLSCVSRVNGGVETQLTPDNVDGFIESPMTLLRLRAEVFKANNFFPKGGQPPLSVFNGTSSPTIKRRG